MSKTALIVQARLGSTRLPGKMLIPFYNGKSILEIVLSRLKELPNEFKIIVATTVNPKDDPIVELCNEMKVSTHRGPEDDVLKRFIDAAEKESVDHVVRVCADNPLLLVDYIHSLIGQFDPMTQDYLSYNFHDGTPVIKSHIGLFAEIVTLNALKKVARLTKERLYIEHVTNFIYANKEIFKVDFLPLPKIFGNRKDIRLTVDTKNDFELTQELYEDLIKQDFTIDSIINKIDSDVKYKTVMHTEIKRNSK